MKQILLFTITLFLWLPTLILAQQTPIEILDGETQITNKDISDTQTYLMSMKVNPVTGQIPLEDVFQARQTADKLAKNGNAKSSEITWESMGPNNIGGRTRAILIDKGNPEKLIAGSVSGGLFTSNDGGLNWQDHPQNLEFASLSISTIAQASNGDIYVGTGEYLRSGIGYGEAKLGGSKLPGTGIYKSTDKGNSFQLLENTIPSLTGEGAFFDTQDWTVVKGIAIHPLNENRIYAATNYGLQISQDGGTTWSKAEGVSSTDVVHNMEIASDGKVHVLVSNRYYQSDDGFNFTDSSTGLNSGQFESGFGNKVIALSPSDNDYVYIVTLTGAHCLKAIWQSKDSGVTWNVLFENTDPSFAPLRCRGWYSLSLAVDPSNPERIFLGGAELWSWSVDNGWNRLGEGFSPNYVHEDVHTMVFQTDNPKVMYVGSSGGITKTTDAHRLIPSFIEMNKDYKTSQFYSIAAGLDGRMVGGTQDNGTIWMTPEYEQEGRFITLETGGFCDMSKIKPTTVFASWQNGGIRRSPDEYTPLRSFLDNNVDCFPSTAEGDCNPDGFLDNNPLFITPFILWEDVIENLLTGEEKSKFITGDCAGEVWMTEEALDFFDFPTWRRIGKFAGNRCISAIAVSNNGKYVYVGTTDGRFMRITNLDQEVPTTHEFALSLGQYITSIDVLHNPSHIIVGLGNYGQEKNIVESLNAISINPTFSSLQYNLPLMPVYSVAIDAFNPNNVLIGTELGVWQYDGTSQTWTENNGIMGRVPVHSLRFEQMGPVGCEVLYAGTHGRGIYRTTDFTLSGCNTEIVGIESLEEQISKFNLFPNPMNSYSDLEFTLTEATILTMQVFDLQGRVVQQQELGKMTAQSHRIRIEKGTLNSGIYYILLRSGNKQMGRKLVVH